MTDLDAFYRSRRADIARAFSLTIDKKEGI
jgi:hypothetical protein